MYLRLFGAKLLSELMLDTGSLGPNKEHIYVKLQSTYANVHRKNN